MAHKIIVKKQFINDVQIVLYYLESEWGKNVADAFLAKIESAFQSLKYHPLIGAPSSKIKNSRGLFITRHNRLFYRVEQNKVVVLRLFDTRKKNYS